MNLINHLKIIKYNITEEFSKESHIKITHKNKVIIDKIITHKEHGIIFGTMAQIYIVAGIMDISNSMSQIYTVDGVINISFPLIGISMIMMSFFIFLPLSYLQMRASEKQWKTQEKQ